MFLIELVTAGVQGKRAFMDGVHLEGLPFGCVFLQHFVALDLLMCSGLVVADRKANKGTGTWEMARGRAGRGQCG